MVIESQLKRLIIFLVTSCVLTFICLGGYAKYHAYTEQKSIVVLYEMIGKAVNECSKDRASFQCDSIDSMQEEFDKAVAFRDKNIDSSKSYFAISVATPFIFIFLWFSGRWIVNGHFKSIDKSKASKK